MPGATVLLVLEEKAEAGGRTTKGAQVIHYSYLAPSGSFASLRMT